MKYQDLKVRDAGRLFGLGLLFAAIACGFLYADWQGLLILNERWLAMMGGVAIGAVISWAGALWYLMTTPEQNARFLEKQKGKGRPKGDAGELIDATNPYYRVMTLAYLFRRRRP